MEEQRIRDYRFMAGGLRDFFKSDDGEFVDADSAFQMIFEKYQLLKAVYTKTPGAKRRHMRASVRAHRLIYRSNMEHLVDFSD